MRLLSELLKYCKCGADCQDCEISCLETDSRKVRPGMVFVALRGLHVDGCDYIGKAQEQGAVAYIYKGEAPTEKQLEGVTIPAIRLSKSADLARLAKWFYRDPSKHLRLIGITGTNGKSTTTWMIALMLEAMGCKCGVLGTLGTGFLPHLKVSSNTTLDALNLQRQLRQMVDAGATYAAMEVSSIGIDQGRVAGCTFAAEAFTNLTRDHLDYHGTMDNYFAAKKKLFDNEGIKAVNCADDYGRQLLSGLLDDKNTVQFHVGEMEMFCGMNAEVQVVPRKFLPDGIELQVESSFGEGTCRLPLLGSFNLENFACALSLLLRLGFDMKRLMAAVRALHPVTGRMECFRGEGKPTLVVDYAHTPDGVEKVLRAAREHHPDGRIFVVLGCGGDRDKGKRPLMAIKASVFADHAVFTSDNPRTEDPEAILHDMQRGVSLASNCVFIVDRRKAIEYAFEKAGPDDCVVIAGKGHEDYQIFKDKTVHFSDREIAAELAGVKLD